MTTTYSEGATYQKISVWDIYVRENYNSPWEKLYSSDADETASVKANNLRAGWQAYAISQRTVRIG